MRAAVSTTAYRKSPIVAIELRNPELLRHIHAYFQRERDAVTKPLHLGLRNWVERMEVLPTAPYGDPILDRLRIGDCWFGSVSSAACTRQPQILPAVTVSSFASSATNWSRLTSAAAIRSCSG